MSENENAERLQKFENNYMKFPFEKIYQMGFSPQQLQQFGYSHAFFAQGADGMVNATQFDNIYSYTVGHISNNHKNKCMVIVCVKNNPKILQYCLQSMRDNDVREYCDILVVDDRSDNQDNMNVAIDFDVSYIRSDNTLDVFNYSMLNNLGAAFAKKYRKNKIICWNSDLFATSKDTVPNLLRKHDEHKSALSGTKLVYPYKEVYENLYPGYSHVLGDGIEKAYGTIQHGGIIFVPIPPAINNGKKYAYVPLHHWRYEKPDKLMANQDQICVAVTGAIHILELDTFIKNGGYACSLASTYQDIELCQRYTEANLPVWYLGSETMLHAETITMKAENNLFTAQYASDQLMYEYLWNSDSRITDVLGIPTK